MQKKSIADIAYDILEESHRPMHYRKITDEVMKIKEIKAENPHHDVNALMGADQRFIRYQRGIWGLVKWKYREAHLPYTLTSYCLRNGTIFLTSYIKPYFNWSRDDRNMEIVFVDDDGEETKAQVNYRQKLIYGLKEWYKHKKLDVNDTLFIGLIDENKRKYFIIAEKDIKIDTEKDIGGIIYKILQDKEEPLTYSQIYTLITKQAPEQLGLFEEYIQNILRNDIRYAEIQKGKWGLVEWLDEIEQLYLNLLYSERVNDFQFSLKKCFDFLGYQTEWYINQQQELIVAQALLDYKSYRLLITGLPKDMNLSAVRAIDWSGIRKIKEKLNIDSVFLFSEEFPFKELMERAKEEGVQLFELSILYKIMKEHQRIPFSLFELRLAFSPMHHPSNNFDKLISTRSEQWDQWSLIREILTILVKASKKKNYMDMNLLIKELDKNNRSHGNERNIEQLEVKHIIEQLGREPCKLIERSESGNLILAYQLPIAWRKVYSLFQFLMNDDEYGENNFSEKERNNG